MQGLKKLEELLEGTLSEEEIKEVKGMFLGYGAGGEFVPSNDWDSTAKAFIEAVNYFVTLVKNR